MNEVETAFQKAVEESIGRSQRDHNYDPIRIIQMLTEHPASVVAKRLVSATKIHEGFAYMATREPELTIEWIMLADPRYSQLFTTTLLNKARERLRRFNLTPPS